MKHFVGCSSMGYLYESRGGDLEVRPEYVGQVIDETPVVGAGMQQEDDGPHAQSSRTNTRSMTTGPHDVHPLQARMNAPLHNVRPLSPFYGPAPVPPPGPSWAPTSMGYYAAPGPIDGGGYGGFAPWMSQAPMQVCPEYLAEACALMDEAEGEIWGASGDWDDDDEQFGVGTIVMPWDVQAEACRQKKWQQCSQRIHDQAVATHNAAAHQQGQGRGGKGSSYAASKGGNQAPRGQGGGTSNARAASCAARAQNQCAQQKKALQQQGLLPDATNSQNVPFCQDAYTQDPQGYMAAAQAAQDAGISWDPQTYAQDPQGYCQAVAQGYDPSAPPQCCYGPPPGYPPPGYGPPPGPPQQYAPQYPQEQDCGDWDDDCGDYCDDQEFAAGAAPAGLGATIGGIAGGILGTFAASPEIGAPIGAALGGAIQGGVCQASQGHGSAPGMQGGAPAANAQKTYFMGTTRVNVTGVYAPDGLFEPTPENMQDPNRAKIATLVHTVNDELRKLKPGSHWNSGRADPYCKGPTAAVKGFFDLPRYATQMQGWTEVQLSDAADWVADKVSGPQEERFIVSGSGAQKIYGPYQPSTLQRLLQQLPAAGMTVSGGNPYEIDTHSHGVTLQAQANGDGTVSISITGKNFYVSQGQVWDKLNGLMPQAGT